MAAQGLVSIGEKTKKTGLVDTFGSYGDVIKSTADRAKMGKNNRRAYIEYEQSKLNGLFSMFGDDTKQPMSKAMLDQFKVVVAPNGIPAVAATEMVRKLSWLVVNCNENSDCIDNVLHCLCTYSLESPKS